MSHADVSILPPDQQFRAERRKKTHRGRRSRGKGARPAVAVASAATVDHMAEANEHLKAAQAAPTKKATHAHLFRALTSLKKAAG